MKRTVKVKPAQKPESKPVIKGKSSFFMKTANSSNGDGKKESTEPNKGENKPVPKEKPSFSSKTNNTENGDSKKKTEPKQITKANLKIAVFVFTIAMFLIFSINQMVE